MLRLLLLSSLEECLQGLLFYFFLSRSPLSQVGVIFLVSAILIQFVPRAAGTEVLVLMFVILRYFTFFWATLRMCASYARLRVPCLNT